jgi:hypothetical protein
MPFIRGRYHINPAMGEALEAARAAEAALLALEERAQRNRAIAQPDGDSSDSDADATDLSRADDPASPPRSSGPVHRIEIEGAEVIPNSSGRATRGFAARIHRLPCSTASVNRSSGRSSGASPAPETHVFSNHGDLLDFLRDQLSRDSEK